MRPVCTTRGGGVRHNNQLDTTSISIPVLAVAVHSMKATQVTHTRCSPCHQQHIAPLMLYRFLLTTLERLKARRTHDGVLAALTGTDDTTKGLATRHAHGYAHALPQPLQPLDDVHRRTHSPHRVILGSHHGECIPKRQGKAREYTLGKDTAHNPSRERHENRSNSTGKIQSKHPDTWGTPTVACSNKDGLLSMIQQSAGHPNTIEQSHTREVPL